VFFRPGDDDRAQRLLALGVLTSTSPVDAAIMTLLRTYGGVYWPFDDLSGTEARSFPTGYAGTYVGGCVLNQSAAPTRLRRGVNAGVASAQIKVTVANDGSTTPARADAVRAVLILV